MRLLYVSQTDTVPDRVCIVVRSAKLCVTCSLVPDAVGMIIGGGVLGV